MNKKALLLLLLLVPIALAHQPRLVDTNFTEVLEPEISQAFYAELTGDAHNYSVSSDAVFLLYVGILVPDIEGIDKDVSARIYKGDELVITLDGTNHTWMEFYEHFAGDNYFEGPEYEASVEEGSYTVEVYSSDNLGKYVLAVGKKEQFSSSDWWDTLKKMPGLKRFFGKPAYTMFFNYIGLFLLGTLVLLAGLVVLGAWLFKKIIR